LSEEKKDGNFYTEDKIKKANDWIYKNEHIDGHCWHCYYNDLKHIKLMEIYIFPAERLPERIITWTKVETKIILSRNKKFFCPICFRETYGFIHYLETDNGYKEIGGQEK
jgi:hypothetical protein